LGLRVEDVSPDGSLVRVRQKAWKSEIHDFLKTENANREIDLHSSLAALLRQQIADRKDGLVFRSKTGKPLSQRNILSRELHPILKELNWKDAESGTTKAGFHAFRCFRNTYLRNYTRTPDGIIHFWMGHAGEGMSDLYDKVRRDIRHRKEAAENAGLGFDLPTS